MATAETVGSQQQHPVLCLSSLSGDCANGSKLLSRLPIGRTASSRNEPQRSYPTRMLKHVSDFLSSLSYAFSPSDQFQQILKESSPEDKLVNLIDNKGWDGLTVYDRKCDKYTTALYLAAKAENASALSWLLEWSATKADDILEKDSSTGMTALHGAITTGNYKIVSILLRELDGEQVNFADNKEGDTPLHTAVKVEKKTKKREIMEVIDAPLHTAETVKVIGSLLRGEADPCRRNIKGNTPLHLAVKCGNLEILRKLLGYKKIDLDTPGPDSAKGQTPLHLAVVKQQKDMVVLLIARGADPCLKDKEGVSPLHLAASQQNESVFQVLLHRALQPRFQKASSVEDIKNALEELRNKENGAFSGKLQALGYGWNIHNIYAGKTALHLASEVGNVSLVQALLKESTEDIVKQDEIGDTALHAAASGGFLEIVQVLLKNGVQSISDGALFQIVQELLHNGDLHDAASHGHLEEVQKMLRTAVGFDTFQIFVDLEDYQEFLRRIGFYTLSEIGQELLNNGAFQAVASGGFLKIVQELLKNDAEINKQNKLGQTPLHFAVGQGRVDIARQLLERDANSGVKDNTGAGLLHFAARGGGEDILDLLKDKDLIMNVNQATKAGLTPLHYAAWNGNIKALHWLLKRAGIKLDVQDKVEKGLPWHWAAMSGNRDCLEMLIREHVKTKIKVFPDSHKEWHRVFKIIEDHDQASIIDSVAWSFLLQLEELEDDSVQMEDDSVQLEELEDDSVQMEDDSVQLEELEDDSEWHMEPGIVACAVAYGDGITNNSLVSVLNRRFGQYSVTQFVKDSRLLEWAAWSSTRSIEFGGDDRFNAVKPVMEFVFNKRPNVKAINNQLRRAFKIAFLNEDQVQYEERGKETFASCMAKCFTWALPDMIKEAAWEKLKPNFKKNYKNLTSKYKDGFADLNELAEDVPVAYWEAKLEEKQMKGSKADKQQKKDGVHEQKGKPLAERVKDWSKKFIKDYPNDTGSRTGRTALHWATIFKETATAVALYAKGCQPEICDTFGRAPYWDVQWVREEKENTVMMNCIKWSGFTESLHKDRQMFVDGLNAILVGSALIASVTFGGFLSPPLDYKLKFKDREYVSIDIAGVVVFWVANSLSFFFAVASALAGVTGVLPSPHKFNLEVLRRLRRILIAAAVMFVLSIIFVLLAFGAAGFSALPPLRRYQQSMIATSVPGALVCLAPLCTFLYAVYNLKSRKLKFLHEAKQNTISQLVALKRCFKAQDPPEQLKFGDDTLEKLLQPPGEPQSPRTYARNGLQPWEDGLDSLAEVGATGAGIGNQNSEPKPETAIIVD